jgi:hypothetical protein
MYHLLSQSIKKHPLSSDHVGGLKNGCPLSPLLVLLIVEGMSRFLEEAPENGKFKWIDIGPTCNITHLLSMDDILIFYECSKG